MAKIIRRRFFGWMAGALTTVGLSGTKAIAASKPLDASDTAIRVREELARIQKLMLNPSIAPNVCRQLYAAQQALMWAADSRMAPPFEVITRGLAWGGPNEVPGVKYH